MIFRIYLLLFLCFYLNVDTFEALKTPNIKGIIVPVPTPYKDNDPSKLDLGKVDAIAKFCAENGADGVLVASKVGEGYMASEEECMALYDAWVEKAACYGLSLNVVVGDPTPTGIRLAQYAQSKQVDAITVLLPLYYKSRNAQAAVTAIKLIADLVINTPVIVYVDPMSLPNCVRIDEFYFLATKQMPNFYGMRYSMEMALQIRSAGLYQSDHISMISQHYSISSVFFNRFNASVAASNCLVPGLAVAIKNAKNDDKAFKIQQKINEVVTAVCKSPQSYISSLKAAFFIITGIDAGNVRAPLPAFTYEDLKRITKNLGKLGIAMKSPVC